MQSELPRPIGVILLAVNYLLIGCFGTLCLPLSLWVFPAGVHQLVSQAVHSPALSMSVTCAIVTLWAAGYILYALIGYGMLKLRTWSLKSAIAAHWVVLALVLISIALFGRYAWLLSLSIGSFCLLWFGGILYYLHRPRVRWPFAAATAIAQSQPIPPQPPASTIPTWKIVTSVLTVSIVAIAIFAVSLFAFVEKSLRSSTAYAMAMDRAQASGCVAKTLGEPWAAKGSISGNLSTNNDGGDADLEIPIHGPKDSGSLHVEAKEISGTWTINSLRVEHGDGQIQLVPTPSPCD